MKTIILSVRPPRARLLVAGQATVDLHKRPLPGDGGPVRAIIYETKSGGGCGMLIGEVVFRRPASELRIPQEALSRQPPGTYSQEAITRACVTWEQAKEYAGGRTLYAWEVNERGYKIDRAVAYHSPRPLEGRPPQSWRWVR